MIGAVVKATEADALWLAPRMNAADRAECWATAHLEPLAALRHSMAHSIEARTWLLEGVPACMWGVCAEYMLGESGNPWLLTSDLVRRYPMTFLRRYRGHLDNMLDLFPRLETMVDARHKLCLRWLKWCGFEIGEPTPFGADGLPFHPVVLRR